ncbi:Regulatory-associated protein of TOR 2 [Platanthera zijinensis]|uniref:Regulatory-associated protein of TOR 2 n=1 Tax=Platanthera zijinensis TaxID=2320716 RepID=A0AAP0BE98_9ASPA
MPTVSRYDFLPEVSPGILDLHSYDTELLSDETPWKVELFQVLLSQSQRFKALVLLGRFLDMGHWAVDQALSVGILPYVLKLLQTTVMELRQILVFIWTKILSLDKYGCLPKERAMAAFVLAIIVDGHKRGKEACIQPNLIHVCLKHLQLANPHETQTKPLLLQWLCLCLGKLWEDFHDAQLIGLQADAPAIFLHLLSEPQPEVRAAAVFALGTLIDVSDSFRDGHGGDEDCDGDEKSKAELSIANSLIQVLGDGSPLVRSEVVVGFITPPPLSRELAAAPPLYSFFFLCEADRKKEGKTALAAALPPPAAGESRLRSPVRGRIRTPLAAIFVPRIWKLCVLLGIRHSAVVLAKFFRCSSEASAPFALAILIP